MKFEWDENEERGDYIRIISARIAGKQEEKEYYDSKTGNRYY